MTIIEPHLADDGVTLVSPPAPRTALFWDGTHWRVPRVDDHGRVQVRGEDQLFSYQGIMTNESTGVISGANGYRASGSPPAGQVWVVTTIVARDFTSPLTEMRFVNAHNASLIEIWADLKAFAANERGVWSGHTIIDTGDAIRAYFNGGLVGDTTTIWLTGYRMTVEV